MTTFTRSPMCRFNCQSVDLCCPRGIESGGKSSQSDKWHSATISTDGNVSSTKEFVNLHNKVRYNADDHKIDWKTIGETNAETPDDLFTVKVIVRGCEGTDCEDTSVASEEDVSDTCST